MVDLVESSSDDEFDQEEIESFRSSVAGVPLSGQREEDLIKSYRERKKKAIEETVELFEFDQEDIEEFKKNIASGPIGSRRESELIQKQKF